MTTVEYAPSSAVDSPSSSALTRTIVSMICVLIVSGFFLYAAYGKIGHNKTRQFAVQIKNYKIIDGTYANIPAIIMPWVEIAAALALIPRRTRKAGAILIGGMLLMFIAAVSYSGIYLDLNIDCGCTGKDGAKAGWMTVGRNVGLLALTLAAVYLPPRSNAQRAQESST